jgi:excisionase family DNA binding protein
MTTLIGTTGAADVLGVSLRTVKRMAIDGELPVHQKLPGQTGAYLFRLDDVERLARRREQAAA